MSEGSALISHGRPKTAQLVERVRSDILTGRMKPGARLPTQRMLCEQYGVGQSTALAAMTCLVGEGLVVRRRGDGSFVSDRPRRDSRTRVIEFVRTFAESAGPERPSDLALIEQFTRLADGRGFKANWHHLAYDEAADVERLVEQFSDARGVVTVLQSNLGPELARQLHLRGVPVVAVWARMSMAPSDPPPPALYPQVTYDRRAVVRKAVDHLVKLGLRRIAFMGGGSWTNGFLDAVAQHKLSIPADWINQVDRNDIASLRHRVLELLHEAEPPAALLFHTDYLASVCEMIVMAEGMRVPQDVAIMACCNGPDVERVPVPISVASIAAPQLFGSVLDLIERTQPGFSPDRAKLIDPIILPVCLTVRGSCGGAVVVRREGAAQMA